MASMLTQVDIDALQPRGARYEVADPKVAGLRLVVGP
jgi:hypothetical protein